MDFDYHITGSEGDFKLSFSNKDGTKGSINGEKFELDVLETNTGYHVIQNGKSYRIDIIKVDPEERIVEMRINSRRYVFNVKDKYAELLHQLGMNGSMVGKASELKAPMPGLVLDILVNEGDDVVINQPLMILEAMKMENVIKSSSDGKVKSVYITKSDTVEKNQVLIEFD